MPFVTMGTFLILNISGIINLGNLPVPYPIYGLLSISLWNLFTTGITQATSSLEGAKTIVSRINLSKSAIVVAAFLQVLIDFSVRIIILSLIYLFYRQLPPLSLFLLPILIIPIFWLTLGLGFLTALFQVVIKDTIQFVTVFINLAILLLPIMYPLPKNGILASINKYNPMVYILTVPRDLIINNSPNMIAYLWSVLLIFIFFLVSWLFFYKAVPKVIEKI
jgi:lipopolysaccharide transport system permease protein